MIPVFTTEYKEILERIDKVDPIKYGKTRNFINGDVTYLSPYISRGVISVKQVWEVVLNKGYKLYQIEKFVQELAWREFFQRVWQHKGELLFADIKNEQQDVSNHLMAAAIVEANTGVEAIDTSIQALYHTGYMHNHHRMYLASVATNIAKSHWSMPAKWMYYHLLDGDLASNTCSWQWVCGAFSSKKYYCNQENINKYTGSNQRRSFLDASYEELPYINIPSSLVETTLLDLHTILPTMEGSLQLDGTKSVLLYNHYNLDPAWHQSENATRILVLEPSHFEAFPVSARVMNFILQLKNNLPDCQVFVGEWSELKSLLVQAGIQWNHVYFKEHPITKHWQGNQEARDWIFPDVTGYYPSFFGFWKKAERTLKQAW